MMREGKGCTSTNNAAAFVLNAVTEHKRMITTAAPAQAHLNAQLKLLPSCPRLTSEDASPAAKMHRRTDTHTDTHTAAARPGQDTPSLTPAPLSRPRAARTSRVQLAPDQCDDGLQSQVAAVIEVPAGTNT